MYTCICITLYWEVVYYHTTNVHFSYQRWSRTLPAQSTLLSVTEWSPQLDILGQCPEKVIWRLMQIWVWLPWWTADVLSKFTSENLSVPVTWATVMECINTELLGQVLLQWGIDIYLVLRQWHLSIFNPNGRTPHRLHLFYIFLPTLCPKCPISLSSEVFVLKLYMSSFLSWKPPVAATTGAAANICFW